MVDTLIGDDRQVGAGDDHRFLTALIERLSGGSMIVEVIAVCMELSWNNTVNGKNVLIGSRRRRP